VNIGANSVVLHSVQSSQTVAGIPAKVIKPTVVIPKWEVSHRLSR